jgi:hypothetical protein
MEGSGFGSGSVQNMTDPDPDLGGSKHTDPKIPKGSGSTSLFRRAGEGEGGAGGFSCRVAPYGGIRIKIGTYVFVDQKFDIFPL